MLSFGMTWNNRQDSFIRAIMCCNMEITGTKTYHKIYNTCCKEINWKHNPQWANRYRSIGWDQVKDLRYLPNIRNPEPHGWQLVNWVRRKKLKVKWPNQSLSLYQDQDHQDRHIGNNWSSKLPKLLQKCPKYYQNPIPTFKVHKRYFIRNKTIKNYNNKSNN